MRVSAEIVQNMLRPAEGPFGVHHPIGAEQRTYPGSERFRLSQLGQFSAKREFAGAVEFAEAGDELAAEHSAEDLHRQEEMGRSRDPLAMIGRQAAGRNDAVDMRVV